MTFRSLVAAGVFILCGAGSALAQTDDDTRAQYPALLRNFYVSFNAALQDVPFSQQQLQPGFSAASVDLPHAAVRVVLFGHEFSRFLSVQGSYMRPVDFITYHNINGAPGDEHDHVRVTFGSVTLKARAPVRGRLWLYGEGGYGVTSRTGFVVKSLPAVTDAHYSSVVIGGGVDYDINTKWSLTAGATYLPGNEDIDEPRALLASAGFKYTMRAIPQERLDAIRQAGFVFPKQVIQLEYSTGIGSSINDFVSTQVPIFWSGTVQTDAGAALHYERNLFHTRKFFSLDAGASAGVYQTKDREDRFYTLSIYPLFRFTFLRTPAADLYFAYSLAGPTFISETLLDGLDTGQHFTFQDFMGFGVFAGKNRNLNFGVKINHFSNGNIFSQNAGLTIPLTFSVGYAF